MILKTGFYILKPNIYANYTSKNYIQTQFDEENWNFYFKKTKKICPEFLVYIIKTQITTLFKLARYKNKNNFEIVLISSFKKWAGFLFS